MFLCKIKETLSHRFLQLNPLRYGKAGSLIKDMFAVGHLALGYITGKTSSQALKLKVNIPLLFVFSVLPDIDLLLPFMTHRGATHSIIVLAAISIPLLLLYKKTVVPYIFAIAQHSLIGDFFGGGIQLLWPISKAWIGFEIPLSILTDVTLELLFFAASLLLMLWTKDLYLMLKPDQHNLLLIVPAATTILPLLRLGMNIPVELIIPHLAYSILFAISSLNHIFRFWK